MALPPEQKIEMWLFFAKRSEAAVAYGEAHPGYYEAQDARWPMKWEGEVVSRIEWHRRDAARWRQYAKDIQDAAQH